jgi:MFS family permease
MPPSRAWQLLLAAVAAAAAAYARTAVSPLQETMRNSLSLSDNQIALLQGPALALPMLAAAVPLGLAIDRYSRARLLLIFAACNLAGTLFTALASNFMSLFLARCLVGLTAPATAIAAISLIADLYAPAQRGRANMAITLGQVGGMSAAFALGGALLSMFDSGASDWRWAMAVLAAPLMLVVLLLPALREPARTGFTRQRLAAREALTELWRHRVMILPLLVGGVLVGTADVAVLIWTAPTLARNFALPPDRVGAIVAMVLLISGISGPIMGGVLADICQRAGGPRRTLIVLSGLTLLSVPTGLFAVMPGVTSTSVLLVLFMTMGGAITVTWAALFTIVVPNELRGLCMMVSTAAGLLFGLGLAPVSVSLLSSALGGPAEIGRALMWICVTISFFGAAMFAFGSRNFSRAVAQ